MATITALMVKDLRGKTDLPMMECKHDQFRVVEALAVILDNEGHRKAFGR